MRIRIMGKNKNYPKEELREFVRWAGSRLGLDDHDFLLIIYQKKGLGTFESGGQKFTMQASVDDPVYPIRTVRMHLRTSPSKRYQEVFVGHEMIHVHQFLNGIMEPRDKELTLWKGRLIKDAGRGQIPYLEAPWEKEAVRRGAALVRAWRKKCQKQKQP